MSDPMIVPNKYRNLLLLLVSESRLMYLEYANTWELRARVDMRKHPSDFMFFHDAVVLPGDSRSCINVSMVF
jgi:hypothetical protein